MNRIATLLAVLALLLLASGHTQTRWESRRYRVVMVEEQCGLFSARLVANDDTMAVVMADQRFAIGDSLEVFKWWVR